MLQIKEFDRRIDQSISQQITMSLSEFKQALADIFRLFQLAELEMRAELQRDVLENEAQWTQNMSP